MKVADFVTEAVASVQNVFRVESQTVQLEITIGHKRTVWRPARIVSVCISIAYNARLRGTRLAVCVRVTSVCFGVSFRVALVGVAAPRG
jgi:hypothetical protein